MTKSWVRKATLLFFPFSFWFKRGKDWAEEETFDPRKVVRREALLFTHSRLAILLNYNHARAHSEPFQL
jgi:hypothetical protein